MASSDRSAGRRLALALLVAAASVPLLPEESAACSFEEPLLEILPADQAAAGEPPAAVVVVSAEVTRGRGEESLGCGKSMSSSCDDIGTLRLVLEGAADPDTLPDRVGFVIEIAGGEAPEGLALRGPRLATRDGNVRSIDLRWIDGADDEQEPIAFDVTVRAIDVDGHEGPVSEPFAIVDPGR